MLFNIFLFENMKLRPDPVWEFMIEFGLWCKPICLLNEQDLQKNYSFIRKTRPDGNCFYRAFGFAYLESLLDDSKELQR